MPKDERLGAAPELWGIFAMESNYPDYCQRLQNQIGELSGNLPGTMRAYRELHKKATGEGALTRTTKELIALGIALNVNCDGCLAYHVRDALQAGATREQILETIGVAVMMGGGPAVVYGCQALEALDQFLAEKHPEVRATAP